MAMVSGMFERIFCCGVGIAVGYYWKTYQVAKDQGDNKPLLQHPLREMQDLLRGQVELNNNKDQMLLEMRNQIEVNEKRLRELNIH